MGSRVNKYRRICILGGTGFVGQHILNRLTNTDFKIRVISRHRERHRELLLFPEVELVTADIHDPQVLKENFSDQDVVINLVGILNQSGKKQATFKAVHVDLTRHIIQACQMKGVKRLLHMSALNADSAKGPSQYLRTKGEAENLVHNAKNINVTSFQPSVIFGLEDDFFNRFARLLKIPPTFIPFPLACADAKFSPVFVDDVAAAFTVAVQNEATFGQRYALCGPESYTLKALVEYTAKLGGIKRSIYGLGDSLSKLQAILLGFVPGQPFSKDNYLSMKIDSVCDTPFPALFNITPASVESIVPSYIGQQSLQARFDDYRRTARR
ncbi:MAG: complex I NDUFA9 subunit family protein [Gammaproteobacteria bacterium]|nr:complex I NDUFA9 subunit family protein [Gammaproteobacteria bacterium]